MAKFVTVYNDVLGKTARVLESRVPHLVEEWHVIPDEEPVPRKRAPRRRAAPAKPTETAAATAAEQPDSAAAGADPEE